MSHLPASKHLYELVKSLIAKLKILPLADKSLLVMQSLIKFAAVCDHSFVRSLEKIEHSKNSWTKSTFWPALKVVERIRKREGEKNWGVFTVANGSECSKHTEKSFKDDFPSLKCGHRRKKELSNNSYDRHFQTGIQLLIFPTFYRFLRERACFCASKEMKTAFVAFRTKL